MNAFTQASLVEERGMARLLPFLEAKSHRGWMVRTSKGAIARELQESFGDVLLNLDEEEVCAIEIKIEDRFTRNLFLEEWSNRNLSNRNNHARLGSNIGWLAKLRADFLFYYFFDKDELIMLPLFNLQQWAFVTPSKLTGNPGRLYDYHPKPQSSYAQKNDTWGRIVPISDLEREVPMRRTSVTQLDLWRPNNASIVVNRLW